MNFKDFFSDIHVAVMTRINPEWVVKNKLVKTNREASYWLMDAEKEIKAIKKLGLSDEEIGKRVWSWKTRLYLLENDVFTVVDDISTSDELNIVIEKAKVVLGEVDFHQKENILDTRRMTPDVLVKAMRKRTPDADTLARLIIELDETSLMAVAEKFPKAFNDLKPCHIFGIKDTEVPEVIDTKYCKFAKLLVKNSTKLSTELIALINNVENGRLGGNTLDMWEWLFEVAFEKNYDVSAFMCRYYNETPDLYVRVRRCISSRENKGSYIRMMWYALVKSHFTIAMPEPATPYYSSYQKEDHKVEAFYWMRIAINNLSEKNVFDALFSDLVFVKKVLTNVEYNHVLSCMAHAFYKSSQGITLLGLCSSDNDIRNINERILAIASASNLFALYPFNGKGWDINLQKEAVNKLIENDKFPVERITELNEEMQEFVKMRLLTRSQILVLQRRSYDETLNLFNAVRLTPDAECFLLELDCLKSAKSEYIKKYGLSPKAFKRLLDLKFQYYENKYEYLHYYADNYGLTEEQWLLIMQSNMADRAVSYSHYVVKSEK